MYINTERYMYIIIYIYIYIYIYNSTLYKCVKIISVQVPFMPIYIHIAIAICVVLSELLV